MVRISYDYMLNFSIKLIHFGCTPQSITPSPTDRISPHPCHQLFASCNTKWCCKKRWDLVENWSFNTDFHSSIFQLNCCFYFLCALCGIEAHRLSFVLPLLPPTHVHFWRAAAQKEWRENIKFWWCYSFFTHHFSN